MLKDHDAAWLTSYFVKYLLQAEKKRIHHKEDVGRQLR